MFGLLASCQSNKSALWHPVSFKNLSRYVIVSLFSVLVTRYVCGCTGFGLNETTRGPALIDTGSPLPRKLGPDTVCQPLPPHKVVSAGLPGRNFTMYIHPPASDVHVSGSIAHSGLWEGHIIEQIYWPRIWHNPDTVVVDIGANIGMYSLIAAQHGLQVIGVEAQINNFKLLCSSIRANEGFAKHLTLYHAAVSDKSGELVSIKNQGDVEKDKNIGGTSFQSGQGKGSILTLTLDQVLHTVTGQSVVLKIDVEGMECEAFAGAQRFLHRNHIRLILMEWAQIASKCGLLLASQFDALGLKPHLEKLRLKDADRWNQWDVIWVPK